MTTLMALDVSTTSTGVAIHNVGRKKIIVATISSKDKDIWKRVDYMVQGVDELIKHTPSGISKIYYEQANVFRNATTIRYLFAALMPILYRAEIHWRIPTVPVAVMRARSRLLKRPPYKKEDVFERLKEYVRNNDEADAIATLFGSDEMLGLNIDDFHIKHLPDQV